MKDLRHEEEDGNPDSITLMLANAIALAVRRPDVIEAIRAVVAPATAPTGLLTTSEVAKALRVSKATVVRLGAEDPTIYETVGTRRRYSLEHVRKALAARGQKATRHAPPPDGDTIDISKVVRRAGLRSVAGGR